MTYDISLMIYDFLILKHKVPECLYNSILLKKDLFKLFNSEKILNSKRIGESQGFSYSTCNLNIFLLDELSSFHNLVEYISKIIVEKYYNNSNKKIIYTRMWTNMLHNNCSISSHSHNITHNSSGFTCVFYYQSNNDGGNFLIMKNEKTFYPIEVKTGDLLILPENCVHSVSKYKGSDPRISFIFDGHLEDSKIMKEKKKIKITY